MALCRLSHRAFFVDKQVWALGNYWWGLRRYKTGLVLDVDRAIFKGHVRSRKDFWLVGFLLVLWQLVQLGLIENFELISRTVEPSVVLVLVALFLTFEVPKPNSALCCRFVFVRARLINFLSIFLHETLVVRSVSLIVPLIVVWSLSTGLDALRVIVVSKATSRRRYMLLGMPGRLFIVVADCEWLIFLRVRCISSEEVRRIGERLTWLIARVVRLQNRSCTLLVPFWSVFRFTLVLILVRLLKGNLAVSQADRRLVVVVITSSHNVVV